MPIAGAFTNMTDSNKLNVIDGYEVHFRVQEGWITVSEQLLTLIRYIDERHITTTAWTYFTHSRCQRDEEIGSYHSGAPMVTLAVYTTEDRLWWRCLSSKFWSSDALPRSCRLSQCNRLHSTDVGRLVRDGSTTYPDVCTMTRGPTLQVDILFRVPTV